MCSANRFSFTKLMDDPDRTSEKGGGGGVPRSLVAFLMAPPAVQPSAPLLAARADVPGKSEAEVRPSGLRSAWR